jgi:hypothetical protein
MHHEGTRGSDDVEKHLIETTLAVDGCVAGGPVSGSRVLTVQIKIPSETEECTICLDKIHLCEVPGFEGLLFDSSKPMHKEIQLICGHSFAANALIVHWLTSPMRCPLCRDGVECKLSVSHLPEQWQKPAGEYIAKCKADSDAADMEVEMLQNATWLEENCVHVSMLVMLITSDGIGHRVPIKFAQSIDMVSGDLVFKVHRADVRRIAKYLSRGRCYAWTVSSRAHLTTMGLDGGMVFATTGVGIEIANSGFMTLPCVYPSPPVGVVNVSHSGENVMHSDMAVNSSFNFSWFHLNHPMLDTLVQMNFQIKLATLMTFLTGETFDE